MILDGGLSTELERRGHDVTSHLWSARLLHDDPDAIVAVHADFLRAGAQVITTASYQASAEGFASTGLDATGLIRRSVDLARRAIASTGLPARVAGSAGPYGAMLADGSEYTGAYPVDAAVREFHRRKLGDLADAGPDLIAAETIPSAAEADVVLQELDRLGLPAWLSLTTTIQDGVVRTRTGEPAAAIFAAAAGVPCVVAVGVNCLDPRDAGAAVRVAATASRPVVVYPNSGEQWDAATRTWHGGSDVDLPALARTWHDAGATWIGGCCRTTPADIAAIAAARPEP